MIVSVKAHARVPEPSSPQRPGAEQSSYPAGSQEVLRKIEPRGLHQNLFKTHAKEAGPSLMRKGWKNDIVNFLLSGVLSFSYTSWPELVTGTRADRRPILE